MYTVFDKAFWSEDEVKNLTPKEIRKVYDNLRKLKYMATDYCELIRDLAKKHIYEYGEHPLDNAGGGMYNLDVRIPNGIDESLNSKYDVIVQCYPNGKCEQVFLFVYYDIDITFGLVDNDCYCLTDFSEEVQQQIYKLYKNELNN